MFGGGVSKITSINIYETHYHGSVKYVMRTMMFGQKQRMPVVLRKKKLIDTGFLQPAFY